MLVPETHCWAHICYVWFAQFSFHCRFGENRNPKHHNIALTKCIQSSTSESEQNTNPPAETPKKEIVAAKENVDITQESTKSENTDTEVKSNSPAADSEDETAVADKTVVQNGIDNSTKSNYVLRHWGEVG